MTLGNIDSIKSQDYLVVDSLKLVDNSSDKDSKSQIEELKKVDVASPRFISYLYAQKDSKPTKISSLPQLTVLKEDSPTKPPDDLLYSSRMDHASNMVNLYFGQPKFFPPNNEDLIQMSTGQRPNAPDLLIIPASCHQEKSSTDYNNKLLLNSERYDDDNTEDTSHVNALGHRSAGGLLHRMPNAKEYLDNSADTSQNILVSHSMNAIYMNQSHDHKKTSPRDLESDTNLKMNIVLPIEVSEDQKDLSLLVAGTPSGLPADRTLLGLPGIASNQEYKDASKSSDISGDEDYNPETRCHSQVVKVKDCNDLITEPDVHTRKNKISQTAISPEQVDLSSVQFNYEDQEKVIKSSINEKEGFIKRKWNSLSIVMRSLILLRNQEVKNIDTVDKIQGEIAIYQLRQASQGKELGKYDNKNYLKTKKNNFIKDALEALRRVELFCDCASIGGNKHIDYMKELLEKDPRRNILERSDREHLINKLNGYKQNALYLAAKNGNVTMVKFLLEQKANKQVESSINRKGDAWEKPLHVAARWGHTNVVKLLIQDTDYTKNDIKKSIKAAERKDVKDMLSEYYRERFGSMGCFFMFA